MRMKEGIYYTELPDSKVQCELCPHNCIIADGKTGNCKVRKNHKGKLYLENYGMVCSLAFDPIEKKPLYHYFPGKTIFSIGNIGCNFHCNFCQNWQISQSSLADYGFLKSYSTIEIINQATSRDDNIGIAYTYNEPTVWYEFVKDVAEAAHDKGLKNVMVTNGYINPQPLEDIIPLIDAFNVDLKAFNEDFYRKQAGGKLEPVKDNLKFIKSYGAHLEITNLVISGLNDDVDEFADMIDWIAKHLGEDTVLHISRYFPNYKSKTEATRVSKLDEFYNIATKKLNYVFLGNVATKHQGNTYCPNCNEIAINRYGYHTHLLNIDKEGKCLKCGHQIINDI